MLPAVPFPENPAATLQYLLQSLTSSQLLDIEFSSGRESIRLDIKTTDAVATLLPVMGIIRIVLIGNPSVYYSSYTEIAATRKKIVEPEKILQNKLFLQGALLTKEQTLILFCQSRELIAAGELHLSFTNFQLYDEAYGAIPLNLFFRS